MKVARRPTLAGSTLALAMIAGVARAELIEEFVTSPLAESFGRPPTISQPRLSPAGDSLLFVQQDITGISAVYRMDFASNEIEGLTGGTEDELDVEWCEWVAATRIACQYRNLEFVFGARETYAVNIDGTDFDRIGLGGCRTFLPLPDDPESIMQLCGIPTLVDLHSRFTNPRRDLIRGDGVEPSFSQVVVDGTGLARLGLHAGSRDRWYARERADSEWERFADIRWQSFEDPFRPVGFGTDQDEALHIAWDGNRWSLYAREMSGDFDVDRLVVTHPLLDLEHVLSLGADNRVVAASYLDEIPRQYIIDEHAAAAHDIAAAALPGRSIELVNESWDGSAFVIRARELDRAGFFFRVDMAEESVQPIGPEYDHLSAMTLAPTRTIQFASHDGGLISAHLTLPRGRNLPVPTVIMPRASPSSWDLQDPHFLVQYLAASGYAVLRVEQRGDAQWGGNWITRKVLAGIEQGLDDVAAAAEYVVADGIAEPGQVCGAGRDVGAYTLFMTDIEHPEAFECIVSIRGVSDSRALVSSPRIYARLDDRSPVRRAKEISADLLLIDNYLDRPSLDFVDRLEPRDEEVTLIEYQQTKPDLDRAPHRIDMLTRIGEFLERHLSEG